MIVSAVAETLKILLLFRGNLRTLSELSWGEYFWPKKEEVAEEELHNLYASPNIMRVIKSRRMTWVCHVALTEEVRNVFRILVWNSEGRNYLEDRRKLENNIRMGLREIGWKGLGWINLAHDRDQWQTFLKTVMNFRVR